MLGTDMQFYSPKMLSIDSPFILQSIKLELEDYYPINSFVKESNNKIKIVKYKRSDVYIEDIYVGLYIIKKQDLVNKFEPSISPKDALRNILESQEE